MSEINGMPWTKHMAAHARTIPDHLIEAITKRPKRAKPLRFQPVAATPIPTGERR